MRPLHGDASNADFCAESYHYRPGALRCNTSHSPFSTWRAHRSSFTRSIQITCPSKVRLSLWTWPRDLSGAWFQVLHSLPGQKSSRPWCPLARTTLNARSDVDLGTSKVKLPPWVLHCVKSEPSFSRRAECGRIATQNDVSGTTKILRSDPQRVAGNKTTRNSGHKNTCRKAIRTGRVVSCVRPSASTATFPG